MLLVKTSFDHATKLSALVAVASFGVAMAISMMTADPTPGVLDTVTFSKEV